MDGITIEFAALDPDTAGAWFDTILFAGVVLTLAVFLVIDLVAQVFGVKRQ